MRYFPLYEAKMFHQFDHRWAEFRSVGSEVERLEGLEEEDSSDPEDAEGVADAGATNLQTYQLTNLQKQDPRYWVSEADVLMRAVPLSREDG